MAQGSSFKHISVSAAEEGDVVVRAGLPSVEEDRRSAGEPAEQGGEPGQAGPGSGGSEDAHAVGAGRRPGATAQAGGRARRDAAAPDPTLDDLRSEPMPLAQRIVIIAAIILIIGALVYYFVAMR